MGDLSFLAPLLQIDLEMCTIGRNSSNTIDCKQNCSGDSSI